MYSFVFKSKLKKLNPHLFVDDTQARAVNGEWKASGLYCNRLKRSKELTRAEYAQLPPDARRYLEAYDGGWLPEFVCGVPTGWIPESDVFDPATGKHVARGWRSIVLTLVSRGFTTLDKARRVFDCPSLGLAAYDRLTIEEKGGLEAPRPASAVETLKSLEGLSRAEIKARL